MDCNKDDHVLIQSERRNKYWRRKANVRQETGGVMLTALLNEEEYLCCKE